MGNDNKPRICEVLGVEPYENFRFYDDGFFYRFTSSGTMERFYQDDKEWRMSELLSNYLIDAINGEIEIHREPRWTVEEQEHAKTIKSLFFQAKYIQKERATFSVSVHDRTAQIVGLIYDEYDELFPHLKDDEIVMLDEILEAETDGKDL